MSHEHALSLPAETGGTASASSEPVPTGRANMSLYAVTVFISAFLLFQIQPLISRFILPWFGGSPTVWSTCMLFFQVLLFGGYVYAHVLTQRCSFRWQAIIHCSLLGIAAVLLPITPDEALKPGPGDEPTFRIITLLSFSIGLPYFLLSSTGPLLQRWYSIRTAGASPWRLYALSNTGSLLALLTYPFVFEPALNSQSQAMAWSVTFAGFGLLCGLCAFGIAKVCTVGNTVGASAATSQAVTATGKTPQFGDYATWFSLAMVASIMLLATTNQVCLDIATVPFLWILPLTLYLVSFILCFDSDRWYRRKAWFGALLVALVGSVQVLLAGGTTTIFIQAGVYLGSLFCCCMVCHGELSRQKPHASHLTTFYLLLAAGGASGGLFTGLLAPRVFPDYWEMHIGILGALCVVLAMLFRDRSELLSAGRSRQTWGLLLLLLCAITWKLQAHASASISSAIEVSRNFYGVLRIQDEQRTQDRGPVRRMSHGSTVHGSQFLLADKRMVPTTYYGHRSGVGLALKYHHAGERRRIGVVGLGVGTLAAHATELDELYFYEINPEVERLARRHFTFLSDTKAAVSIVPGDARLRLAHEAPRHFDVLVIDAFSGDGIPTHLLTTQAGEIYGRHLQPDGLLCIHISNRHLDLAPVVQGLADGMQMNAVCVWSNAEPAAYVSGAEWMILSREPVPQPLLDEVDRVLERDGSSIQWTDEWSNLLSVLR